VHAGSQDVARLARGPSRQGLLWPGSVIARHVVEGPSISGGDHHDLVRKQSRHETGRGSVSPGCALRRKELPHDRERGAPIAVMPCDSIPTVLDQTSCA
jgi:hypothetical protein